MKRGLEESSPSGSSAPIVFMKQLEPGEKEEEEMPPPPPGAGANDAAAPSSSAGPTAALRTTMAASQQQRGLPMLLPPPPLPPHRDVYEEDMAALEYVMFRLVKFPPKSLHSVAVTAFRDGVIARVEDLCQLRLPPDEAVGGGTTAAQAAAAAARNLDRDKLSLIKRFRAHWRKKRQEAATAESIQGEGSASSSTSSPLSGVPTSDDWLKVSEEEFDKFASELEEEDEVQVRRSVAARSRAQQNAQAFVDSITSQQPEPISGSDGMSVLRDIVDLEVGTTSVVVIRKVTKPFWQACINTTETTGERRRVCAVGTPGIGKTAATPVLIKMLLERRKTVVYLVRTEDKDGWFYEFIPGSNEGDPVVVNVYAEKLNRSDIPSLEDPSTYFVVDPGETDDNCNPDYNFQPKVIIVASPDSNHWGRNKFRKRRRVVVGEFKFFPVWELYELCQAREAFDPLMTDATVRDRYSQVGGVPRHIFGIDDRLFNKTLIDQSVAANSLTLEQVERIALGKFPSIPTLDSSQPQSALIGFRSSGDDGFSNCTVEVISPLVGARLFREFMMRLWDKLQLPSPANPWLFEAYCRYLLGTNRTFAFQCRKGVGKRHSDRSTEQHVLLRGCFDVRATGDIVAAAMDRHSVLFYPLNPQEKLIDFVYRDAEGHVHAFQVTMASNHTASVDDICALEAAVGAPNNLTLYYAVPDFKFQEFVTTPRDPSSLGVSCNIFHVSVPDPNSVPDSYLSAPEV